MTHSEYRLMVKTDKEKAQRMLFDEYLNYVYTIVYNRLRSCARREDIDECVSDVFADVYSSYNSEIAVIGDIKGFIGTVAYRKSASYYNRLCKLNTSVSLDDDITADLPSEDDVSETAEQNEVRRILLELIDSLGEPDSTIIIQKFFYNRTSREIAEFVPLSPVMIRVRSSRALKKLRKMLLDADISL